VSLKKKISLKQNFFNLLIYFIFSFVILLHKMATICENRRSVYLILVFLLFFSLKAHSQQLFMLHEGDSVSLRGLSAATDKIVWVSGNKGRVGRSTDGGNTWQWITVPGYETRDFRDIEAFDQYTALIMAVGEPAVILKTIDGGKVWKRVFFDNRPGMFLDAMEFWNDESGIVIGDPIGGKFYVARTFDNGFNWRPIAQEKLPVADSAEACFAASGTNVRALDRDEACFITGGSRSRLFWKGSPKEIPVIQGKQTQGANSVAVWYKKVKKPHIAIVGGDFANESSREKNCVISKDGGESWIVPSNPPHGYRSCVEYASEEKLVTCGITGVDVSLDEGINWNNISSTGFHVCRKAKKGKLIFLAGASGRIAKLRF
jgi:photosystem II stability/assembly factor-like uncharacterized protein